MAYNVQDRYDKLGTRFREVNPDPVGTATYVRKDGSTLVDLVVSLGHTNTQEMIPGVAITQIRYQDFMIDVADLDFGAGPFKPEMGDKIIRANGDTFKVIVIGGEPGSPFEYVTATKKRMRVHTEQIKKA